MCVIPIMVVFRCSDIYKNIAIEVKFLCCVCS